MMKNVAVVMLSTVALGACAPAVPDSGTQGAGFESYGNANTYRNARDAELVGAQPGPTVIPPNSPDPLAGATASTTPAAPINPNNPGISDEQDFTAVSNRQSIESDAERLRQQRESYQQVAVTAVPNRVGSSGPNIVAFALSTSHPVGQKVYRRSVLGGGQAKFDRNCARYSSSNLAQEDFLRAGGPEKDRLGVDPDGDGYACGWNPSSFRRISS